MSKNCDNCSILQQKIKIYEKCINDLKKLDDISNSSFNLNEKTLISNSFVIIENGIDLSELSDNTLKTLQTQDNLCQYKKIEKSLHNDNNWFGFMRKIVRVGKWVGL